MKPIGGAALRRFRPYPAYKDSGVDWLGQIPAHWEAKRLSDDDIEDLGYGPDREEKP